MNLSDEEVQANLSRAEDSLQAANTLYEVGHQLGELMEQYGGTRSHAGKQVNEELRQLAGSESNFAHDLSEFVAGLHREADKHQE